MLVKSELNKNLLCIGTLYNLSSTHSSSVKILSPKLGRGEYKNHSIEFHQSSDYYNSNKKSYTLNFISPSI